MSDLKTIIERVEAASGPDRELDRDILVTVCGMQVIDDYLHVMDNWYFSREGDEKNPAFPSPTASLDAVMALKQDGHTFAIGDCNEDGVPWACVTSTFGTDYAATGATVVLAWLSAILQARLAMEGSE